MRGKKAKAIRSRVRSIVGAPGPTTYDTISHRTKLITVGTVAEPRMVEFTPLQLKVNSEFRKMVKETKKIFSKLTQGRS